MASEIIVQTIKGPTSGANANKIIIPSGQTLDASEGFVPPVGTVVNVSTEHTDGNTITSSTTYVSTGLSVSYTPKKAGNLIIIQSNMGADTNSSGRSIRHTIFRDSTDLGSSNGNGSQTQSYAQGGRLFAVGNTIAVDSNVTAAARTYSVRIKSGGGYSTEGDGTGGRKTMIITEIAQ